MALDQEYGYDKVSQTYGTKAQIESNLGKLNTFEFVVATDTNEVYYKDENGVLQKIVDKDTLSKLENLEAGNIEYLKKKNLKIGDVIQVLGFYNALDGANHYRKIESSSDGSGVQLDNGLWANIVHNGEINVSWFGAKGDGVTDDTQAIQKTVYYICSLVTNDPSGGDKIFGGRVMMSAKDYIVSSTITINKNNVSIIGNHTTIHTAFNSYGILFKVGSAEEWYNSGKIATTNKYNTIKGINIKLKSGSGTLAILFSGTRNSNIEDVLIERQNIGVYSENSSEFNYTNVSCIGCQNSFIFDNRFKRAANQTPLGISSFENDCSSGVVINPTSYYSQKNCFIFNSVGNIEITGATCGVFAEKESDTIIPYELGDFKGKSIVVSNSNTGTGFVRSLKLNNIVFEAKPGKKTSCVFVKNLFDKGAIDNVSLTNCTLQTYEPMNNLDDIYTTFLDIGIDSSDVYSKITVDNCNIIPITNGYIYPCFYENKNGFGFVTFSNCTPFSSFARGIKNKLNDDMIIIDKITPEDITSGTIVKNNGESAYRLLNTNDIFTKHYRAVDWDSGNACIMLDIECDLNDLEFYTIINGATDTNSSIYSQSNITRYSNSNLKFEQSNKRTTLIINFNSFDANYAYTGFAINVKNKGVGDVKVYGIKVGYYNICAPKRYNPFRSTQTLEL